MTKHHRPKPKITQLSFLILLMAAVIAVMMSLRQCSHNPEHLPGESVTDDDLMHGDTLRVAILYAPMSYYVYDDTIGGLNHDLLKRLSADLDVPIRMVPVISLKKSFDDLRSGHTEMLAAIPMVQELKNDFVFTEPLYLDRSVLVQLKGKAGRKRINSSLDLAGDTLHVAADSPAVFRLENLSKEIGASIHVKTHADLSDEYLAMQVASGKIRHAVVNEKTALRLQEQYPLLDASTPISFTQFQSWIFAKKDSLKAGKINRWILEFKESAEYDSLLRRYEGRTE